MKNLSPDESEGVSRVTQQRHMEENARLSTSLTFSSFVFLHCHTSKQGMILVANYMYELWNYIASLIFIFCLFHPQECTLKTQANCLSLSLYPFIIKKFPTESIQKDKMLLYPGNLPLGVRKERRLRR